MLPRVLLVCIWSQRLLVLSKCVVALPGWHMGPAREEPSFGSRAPVGSRGFSEVTAIYPREANGVTCSEIGTTRMSESNEVFEWWVKQ